MTGPTGSPINHDQRVAQSIVTEQSSAEIDDVTASLQVVSVTDDYIVARGQRLGGCSKCQQRQSCPSGAFAKEGEFTIQLPINEQLQVGDQVQLQCSGGQLFGAFAVLFGVPVIGMVAVPLALEYWTQAIAEQLPLITSLEVLVGFALGLSLAKVLAAKVKWQPRISHHSH
ncbi:SoxR reducing system RseC family protein [Neiella sp. HB171785]|uniref:SoxR reducing system RseC family protein n=1 Tax=Neiella litorisoli TaxID=2771431 RepID=A0A8J6QFB2_9GAMM|nr:SoxR reducing system RseC family protein [Neiella litorisoli]MBD1388250.1 SoxR reducing system RseC family protein [Neiella litorisoli]